jgi:hypothetical protein
MTIEIHEPELEAMIQQRLDSGRYKDVEDVLRQALQQKQTPSANNSNGFSGAELIAAFQACPWPEVDIEPERHYAPVRDVGL